MAAENEKSGSFALDTQGSSENAGDDLVVRLRGLPYSATRLDIKELLNDCKIVNDDKGVTFTFLEDGRPSGEAFVDLTTEDDVTKALDHNNEHMGRRYVEIFRASKGEKEWDLRVSSENKPMGDGGNGGENVVRLRGLPFGVSHNQVDDFFSGLSLISGGITIQKDEDGRETGTGFVEFISKEEAEKALGRDRKTMGHRYIEVFRSTQSEVKSVKTNKPTPYDRPSRSFGGGGFGGYGDFGRSERSYSGGRSRGGYGGGGYGGGGGGGGGGHHNQYYDKGGSNQYYDDRGGYSNSHHQRSYDSGYQQQRAPPPPQRGDVSYPPPSQQQQQQPPPSYQPGGYVVRMRGLPYSAKESDISSFFAPQVPVKINLELDSYDRPSGAGMVSFATRQDAELAMGNNKKNIGHRYIELFPQFNEDSPQQQPQQQQQQQQQHWVDPRGAGQQGPPADTNYQSPQQYHQPAPQQQQSYGSGYGGSYQQQSGGGYQQQPATTWAGVGY